MEKTYLEFEPGSVVIALSTYPYENDGNDYIDTIERNIEKVKESVANRLLDLDDQEKNTYKETYQTYIKYHIWGKCDLALIGLSSGLSISNRIFFPTELEEDTIIGHTKNHVLSGVSIKCGERVEDKFRKLIKNENGQANFVCISNLKINNAFLLGNGYDLIQRIVAFTAKKLEGKSFLLINSYASFEISLVIFEKDIGGINPENFSTNILQTIRQLTIKELFRADETEAMRTLFENSLFEINKASSTDQEIQENKKFILDLKEHPVFVDTQSFYGIRLSEKQDSWEGYGRDWAINNKDTLKNYKLKTRIEWEVKPGHEYEMEIAVENHLKEYYPESDIYSISGKTDYHYVFSIENLELSYELYKVLRSKKTDLIKHINRVNTKILFKYKNDQLKKNSKFKFCEPLDHVRKLVYTTRQMRQLEQALTRLKVSSELRKRIGKVFYIYNAAIQSQLVYGFFLDLTSFVNELYKVVINWGDEIYDFLINSKIQKRRLVKSIYDIPNVHALESSLDKLIDIFEDAFNLRYLNNYLLEGVYDFFLEYNTPIQQLITGFDNYFKSLLSLFKRDVRASQIVTRVNQLDTTATTFGVNFSIYNLHEPGILFYYATKEIYTIIFKDAHFSKNTELNQKKFGKYWDDYGENNPDSIHPGHLKLLQEFPHQYLAIDYLRFELFFNKEYDLFVFWHLSFMLQYPPLYSSTGKMLFNERFETEFIRLLFVAISSDYEAYKENQYFEDGLFEMGDNEIMLRDSCPKADLRHAWKRAYSFYREAIFDLVYKKDNKHRAFVYVHDDNSYEDNLLFTDLIQFYDEKLANDIFINDLMEERPLRQPMIDQEMVKRFNQLFKEKTFRLDIVQEVLKYKEFRFFCLNLNYAYLKYLFDLQDGLKGIRCLIRNRATGKASMPSPKETILEKQEVGAHHFLLDPMGGAYFHSHEKQKIISRLRNQVFALLVHLGCLFKKEHLNVVKKTKQP